MAIRVVDFKWYDGFFLSMLATSVIIVAINWNRYHLCTYPLHIWTVVNLLFCLLTTFFIEKFVDGIGDVYMLQRGNDLTRPLKHSLSA